MAIPKVNRQTDDGSEVPAEIIAQSIVEIADAMKVLSRTRLSREAIITLIHARSKVGKRDIELVLNNLEALERIWLKPKPKNES